MTSASSITKVPDKETHDRLITSSSLPTILYLSSSVLPACKKFTPEFEGLARKYCKHIEIRPFSGPRCLERHWCCSVVTLRMTTAITS